MLAGVPFLSEDARPTSDTCCQVHDGGAEDLEGHLQALPHISVKRGALFLRREPEGNYLFGGLTRACRHVGLRLAILLLCRFDFSLLPGRH